MTDMPPPPGGGASPPPSGGGFGPPGGDLPPPPPGGGIPPPPQGFGGGSASPWGPLAEFQDRVVAGLIDYAGIWLVGWLLATFGGGVRFAPGGDVGALYWVGTVIQLLAVPWGLYNGYLAGQTGQSIGMKQAGLRLVGEQTGQPIGGNQGLVRNLLLIPGFCCCGIVLLVDGLFPLWDAKKQTLRDKIGKSVVLKG